MTDPDLDRRRFLLTATALGAGGIAAATGAEEPAKPVAKIAITLPALPYDSAALDPVISANTLGFHYGKHHKGYVDNLAKLLPGTAYEGQSLEAVVRASVGKSAEVAIYNNAAQAWNHGFYWQSLSPKGGGKPGTALGAQIDAAFGSLDGLRTAFLAAAAGQFGSGWVWLTQERASKKLALQKTGNADTPLTGQTHVPLAVLDVWEHAYYLDYQNRRADYASAVFDKLLNWSFVEENLGRV